MSVNSINGLDSTAASYATSAQQNARAAEQAKSSSSSEKDEGVVYDKGSSSRTDSSKNIYSREAIVAQMKKDAEERTAQLRNMVAKMISSQGAKIGQADSIWRFLASGDYTVSPEVKAQAQKDIAEDGYWGVEQTSDRIIEFAKALTGGDESKVEEMRNAFEKGFKMATGAWGSKLPDISQRTYDAVMKKFDEWAGVENAQAAENAATKVEA